MIDYVIPKHRLKAFNCPICNAYSEQAWTHQISLTQKYTKPNGNTESISYPLKPNYTISTCLKCKKNSIWVDEIMIYPLTGNTAIPSSDMPEDVKMDYEEARSIVNLSPKGAVALLRLAVQKLCIHLGGKGKSINSDIKSLVEKGLPETMQKALDSIRVTGNHAVHPGVLDLNDDPETAHKLFGFINVIVDILITQPKKIDEYYRLKLPEKDKINIAKRNGKAT